MCIELKIKSKHLALEPGIIKLEERKLLKRAKYKYVEDLYDKVYSLVNHRKIDVRNEARATQLAIAYLKGKNYNKVEQKRKPGTDYVFYQRILPRVLVMIRKYGVIQEHRKINMDDLKEWSMV